jgi:D-alanine-D-alanine ligase
MSGKVVGVIHNLPLPHGQAFSEASADIMTQVEAIEEALADLGHRSVRIPFTREVSGFISKMRGAGIEMALNLCESLDEDPRFLGHSAALVELLEIPFSGSPSIALMITTDKVMTKRMLKSQGIRTPHYMIYRGTGNFDFEALNYPVVLKPIYEDASIGIDQESVFKDGRSLKERIQEFFDRFGPLLAEEYVGGREFNVSLFGYPSPRVLPLAEIDFSDFPEDLFPIVGYRAKWDTSSFEYYHTPRRFPQGLPFSLRQGIEGIALECFHLLMLRDYGRIDMRVDDEGQIYILEVNANPCLSPDAGFAAAAQQAGISYTDMVETLVEFVEKRANNDGAPPSHT